MRRVVAAVAAIAMSSTILGAAWHIHASAPATTSAPPVIRDADNGPAGTPTTISRPATRAAPTATTHRSLPSRPATAAAKYLVLFVLDGARPDYFNVSGIPHIRALMKNGTQFTNAFAGILESETPSGHAAIGSGSVPRRDGILSFDWANSDNTTVDLFDPARITDGTMDRILRDAPAPSISQLVHKYARGARVAVLGGHKYYAQDAMGGPDADAIMYYTGMPDGRFAPVAIPGHMPPAGILTPKDLTLPTTHLPVGIEDTTVMKLAVTTFHRMQPRVMLINEPEFDWPLGHVDGGSRDPKEVALLMRGFDRGLAALEEQYKKAGILDQTLFVVTADHGFSTIYHQVTKDDIDHAVTQAGTQIISDTYHTAAYMWLSDESRASLAASNIAKLANPYIQSVYFKEPTSSGGYQYVRASGSDRFYVPNVEAANQYLLGTFNGPRGPDLTVFFTEGTASLPGGEASWKGDHGGADWESQHLPLIMSGPGVQRGVVSSSPAMLIDIAPTALALMGIPHTGMDGIPLAEAMTAPSRAQVQTRHVQVASLSPLVSSLTGEAAAEVRAGL